MSRQTKLSIDLNAIRHNFLVAQKAAPDSKTMAVVKANAYGHGMAEVSEVLLPLADGFAVATLDEALALRKLTDLPVLVLQGVQRAEELVEASLHQLSIMVHHPDQVALIKNTALHQPISLWIKIDTGMHRLGLMPDQVPAALTSLREVTWVAERSVICSHFANASEPEHSDNEQQWQVFERLMTEYGNDYEYSFANSPALLSHLPRGLDWNRPGIMLYGGAPFDDIHYPAASDLQVAMQLTAEVIAIRTISEGESVGYGSTWTASRSSRIATIAIGYADGYPRHAPAGTPVAINGQRAAIVGRVSMDMITVDVTDLDDVVLGDLVEMWGSTISVNEIAERLGTISYELMTSISPRVPREYSTLNY